MIKNFSFCALSRFSITSVVSLGALELPDETLRNRFAGVYIAGLDTDGPHNGLDIDVLPCINGRILPTMSKATLVCKQHKSTYI